MEKENNIKREKNVKKINVKVNNNPEGESVLDFYNNKIKKIHIITAIVVTILYIISFVMAFAGIGAVAPTQMDSITEQLQTTLAYSAVVIIAGVVPYFFLSFGGAAQVMALMGDFGARYTAGKSFAISLFTGGLLNCIGISLCIAAGFYLCYLTTKKRKYYNSTQFSMDDVKMQFYQMRSQDKKIKEMEKKQIEKARKAEENNVKIPYLKLTALGVVGYVIQIIGLLIARI